MGNQLVGIAASQIFPVEHYLSDLAAEFKFDVNLGSTRFLKVARAKSQEGLIVVKVFAIHDPSLPLSTIRDKLEEIRIKLSSAVNCLPFQKTLLTDKAGFMVREFVKYTLYDRISTRPFLCPVEKRWIAFQVIYALHQCHKLGVCHGDIKLENIMITSWNWVLLTDFASYKPTILPEDNPADYSYFFDTSRRRTCYIAPERFSKTCEVTSQLLPTEVDMKRENLMPAMDIFSAGCALTELFNEGHPPFDFSQLLAYRSGEYSNSKSLERLEDPEIRELLRNMMERDPSVRLSAETILAQQRNKVFPEYFYSFLQSYMLIFSTTPILSSDEKISRLKKDIKNIVKMFQCEDTTSSTTVADGLVIIVSLVTSCIRGLHYCSSKLHCLEILVELSTHSSSETILDRIVPYIFHLLKDDEARVRVMSIHCLNKCLSSVHTVPCTDTNIFPEYILPTLVTVCQDESVLVRAAYAETIAQFAETALKFLEQQDVNVSQSNFEKELNTLTEMIQHAVVMLLKDPDNLVKQTLLENGITRLCVFFGKQRAHDILLSHMITFLNDKEDKHLRGTFFDSIVGVAAYVGWHGTTVLLPLLQQGLSDPEEFVIVKAINAVTSLTELGLITKLTLYDLLKDMVCFLVHPNLWIRQAIVGFVSAIARTLELVDVQSKVLSVVQPYLTTPLIQVDKEVLVLKCLKTPVPRSLYDSVVKHADIALLLQTFRQRQENRQKLLTGHLPVTIDQPTLRLILRRLASEGLTDVIEEQLLAMSDHLLKIHKRFVSLQDHSTDGVLDLKSLNVQLQKDSLKTDSKKDAGGLPMRPKTNFETPGATMNEEWQHMFGSREPQSAAREGGDSTAVLSPTVESVISPQPSVDVVYSIQEKSYIQYRCAPCRAEFREMLTRKQEQYANSCIDEDEANSRQYSQSVGWRPRGTLVAHLHEHRGCINRVVTIPESPIFASCSTDGFIRVWDCSRMEGRNIANRSCQTLGTNDALVGLALCDYNQSLASASTNGTVFVARIDAGHSKMLVTHSKQLQDDYAVDINSFGNFVVVYATMFGSVIGWDLRSPTPVWKLDNDLKYGVITTFCVDSQQNWLTLGTSSGHHICWDLRFHLPISTITHPSGSRVRRVLKHPKEPSCVFSAVQGNNEVSSWNLETGLRQTVLWASNTPPLSQTQISPHSVCAMCTISPDAPFLLTGSSDLRVRFWDLEAPTDSYIVVPAVNDTAGSVLYKPRLVESINVVHEVYMKHVKRTRGLHQGASLTGDTDAPRAGPEQPHSGHHDWISEVATCHTTQYFMMTGSRDGVIKIWK